MLSSTDFNPLLQMPDAGDTTSDLIIYFYTLIGCNPGEVAIAAVGRAAVEPRTNRGRR